MMWYQRLKISQDFSFWDYDDGIRHAESMFFSIQLSNNPNNVQFFHEIFLKKTVRLKTEGDWYLEIKKRKLRNGKEKKLDRNKKEAGYDTNLQKQPTSSFSLPAFLF